jgi:hypothetical protein
MSSMDELAQFLRDRLGEAEKRARRGYYSDTHWEMFTTEAHLRAWQAWREYFPREQWDVKANDTISEAARDGIRARITAHEADRAAQTIAAIAAKRRLLDAYAEVAANDIDEMEYAHGYANALGEAVRIMGTEHAGHPDYKQEWAP